MVHSIRAIVGPLEVITNVMHAAGSPRATDLPSGMAIIPLGEPQIAMLAGDDSRERIAGFGDLSSGLERRLAALAARGAFAYIETEYWGGTGGQGAAVFSPGIAPVHFTEPTQANPINSALRSLGVRALPGVDEFDTLGLGRFRGLKNLGLNYDGTPAEPAAPPSSRATVRSSLPRQRRAATAVILGTVALAAFVVIFWIGPTLLMNMGFEFALP